MRPIVITRQLDGADPNGIALDQTTAGAGNLTLNGAFVTDGIATLDTQRQVALESTGNLSAITFTVTGTNQTGLPITESLAGPNNSTVATTLNFLIITQISVDGAVGTNVEAGTNETGATIPIILDYHLDPFNVSLSATITGTVNATVQFTFDQAFDDPEPFTWTNHADLTNITATSNGTFISPVTACRLLTNSGDGTTVFRVIQAGILG